MAGSLTLRNVLKAAGLLAGLLVVRIVYFYSLSNNSDNSAATTKSQTVAQYYGNLTSFGFTAEDVSESITDVTESIADSFTDVKDSITEAMQSIFSGEEEEDEGEKEENQASIAVTASSSPAATSISATAAATVVTPIICNDTVWCNIAMPKKSLFRFNDPPNDPYRWRDACAKAASGEQVLLNEILKVFPNHLDFLDGDIYFRKYNLPADVFIDHNRDLSFLSSPSSQQAVKQNKDYKWEKDGHRHIIPSSYNFYEASRAPIIKIGYFAFSRESKQNFFHGTMVGETVMERHDLYKHWKAIRDHINTPFILLHSANENWGFLSTHFPNRTETWGLCCTQKSSDVMIQEILDHPKLLLFMVNQHHNLTHSKLLSLPRGMPISREHGERMMWDTMRIMKSTNKNSLVFTSSSSWKHRPIIASCIRSKFNKKDFEIRNVGKKTTRYSAKEYYQRLSSARTGIALPGLGYDTFRLWESLTIGTVPVLEKSTGLDKTLWKLPALLVEDFDDVTPQLLRTAYVEAVYRAKEFEFERLTQSFWWSFIMNVSATQSTAAVLQKFPLEAEDSTFTRPYKPFDCWQRNQCGAGTKRIPKHSCGGINKS